jgi:hypothetical protein
MLRDAFTLFINFFPYLLKKKEKKEKVFTNKLYFDLFEYYLYKLSAVLR